MRTLPVVLVLLLLGCSNSDKGSKKAAPAPQDKPEAKVTEQHPPADETPSPAVTPQPDPSPAMVVQGPEEAAWVDEGARAWEPTEPTPPAIEEEQKSLLESLTSMYGVRLPRSNSRLSLESVIGAAGWTVTSGRVLPGGTSEFAREILVSISKREIFVNNYRVAPIVCSTPDGQPCPDSFEADSGEMIYRVDPSQLTEDESQSFIITPLLKQLEDIQRARRAVLSGISDQAADWLMDCDVFNIAADRTVPYLVLAQVIHTAGHADLTRVRLVSLDDNDALTYVPVLAPRLDHSQTRVSPVVGGSFRALQGDQGDKGFLYAYINFSASVHPETFAGVEEPDLPACLPATVAWDRVLDDPEYARLAREQLDQHIDALRASHGELLGLTAPPVPPGVSVRLGLAAAHDEDGTGTASPSRVPVPMGMPDFPRNRVVGAEAADRADVVEETDLPSPEEQGGPALGLRPFVFVTGKQYVLAFRTLDDHIVQAVALDRSQPERLYDYLVAASGWSVGVGASFDLPVEELVRSLDTVRHRCSVHSMSGKCKRWDPILPHVYFFVAPDDRFAQARRADAPPATDEAAAAPADGGSAPVEEGDGGPADAVPPPAPESTVGP